MEMKLIDYTGFNHITNRHAENVLMFAKNTRLMRTAENLEQFNQMTNAERSEQLEYIAHSIPSSWEFIHYTIFISNVTRAFTHQLVRTRHASFAQQAMRVAQMDDFTYLTPARLREGDGLDLVSYQNHMEETNTRYKAMIKRGVAPEDARGILPTNIKTNILISANLRTIVELVRKRSSPRVQGEYREFIGNLQRLIENVHPFTTAFFALNWEALNAELELSLADLPENKRQKIAKLFSKVTEGVTP